MLLLGQSICDFFQYTALEQLKKIYAQADKVSTRYVSLF